MTQGLNELKRIFGADNIRETYAAQEPVYEITLNLTAESRNSWAATTQGHNEVHEGHHDDLRFNRINMYLDLLRQLDLDAAEYKHYYHGHNELLYLKKEDIETPRVIGILKSLREENILHLEHLLQEQGQVNLGHGGDAVNDQEAILKKLRLMTGVAWRVAEGEAGKTYQTLGRIDNPRSAAYALGEQLDDTSFVMHNPKDKGTVTIPAAAVSLEKIQYNGEDLRSYFAPNRGTETTRG